jgi:hypothetical protein
MATLRPGLDLRPVLLRVARDGAAFVEHALNEDFLATVQREVAGVPFETMAPTEGRARQGGEQFHTANLSIGAYPAIRELRDDLARLVHRHGAAIEGCSVWEPNEVYVQRYRAGDLGITAHLDLKRYRHIVAVFTADGTAPFTICKNRDGDPLVSWPAARGTLILLRAPGLGGLADHRPLHAVSGPQQGQRVSISYRMDATAACSGGT